MAITGTSGTRAISKQYPVTEGLILESTKIEGKQINLVAEEEDLTTSDQRLGL